MKIPSILLARMRLSVTIKGLRIALPQIRGAIQRFCTPAFFYHENETTFDLTSAGSAVLIRYKGRNFAICTSHQLGLGSNSVDPKQFSILVDNNKVALPPNHVAKVKVDGNDAGNFSDILIAEYDDFRSDRDLCSMFLEIDIGVNPNTISAADIITHFAIGYPTFNREVGVELDTDGIPSKYSANLRQIALYLVGDEGRVLDTENRIPMTQDDRADEVTINPDGMSGAPVFFIAQPGEGEAILGFTGMITNARDRRYMVYAGNHVKQILDRYIDESN